MTFVTDRVIITIDNGVADVRFNRPDKRNALDGAQFQAIAEAGNSLLAHSGVRAVVVSGEGPSFCAGLDFSGFAAMASKSDPGSDMGSAAEGAGPVDIGAPVAGSIGHLAQHVCWVWQEIPVPVIMAVHGHAIGGGLQIALGGDMRVAHPDTKWSVREIHWGLVPDMTGTFMLSRLVRNDIARELAMTGRMVDGAEAARIGLVTRISETPYETAMELAVDIAGQSPQAVRGIKRLFNNIFAQDAAQQLAMERDEIGKLIGSSNQMEAITANLEGRPPAFTD